jgi:heme exporter protein D
VVHDLSVLLKLFIDKCLQDLKSLLHGTEKRKQRQAKIETKQNRASINQRDNGEGSSSQKGKKAF